MSQAEPNQEHQAKGGYHMDAVSGESVRVGESQPQNPQAKDMGVAAVSGVAGWRERPRRLQAGEQVEIPPESLTQNDQFIVESLLNYPDREVHEIVVGSHEILAAWPNGTQEIAQSGICDLMRAEYESLITFGGQDIRGMRESMSRLITSRPELYASAQIQGCKLAYQSISKPERFGDTEWDFLHFGVRYVSAGQTKLPSPRRVYVNTKPWAGGEVATSVIRTARAKNYSPYGKAIDQSTLSQDVSQRKDQLLFVVDTQEQLDIAMDALRREEGRHPDFFNDDVILLGESTDVRGVAFAEEPPREGGIKMSFNERADGHVTTAWNKALDACNVPSLGSVSFDQSVGGRRERAAATQALLSSGKLSMPTLVASFRAALRSTAPQFGISPDNLSRNMTH